MHFLAPLVILFGVVGVIVGLMWLVAAGAEDDGGPSVGLFAVFGTWYLAVRVMKQFARDPMSVLPAFGFLLAGAGLVWLGVVMI